MERIGRHSGTLRGLGALESSFQIYVADTPIRAAASAALVEFQLEREDWTLPFIGVDSLLFSF